MGHAPVEADGDLAQEDDPEGAEQEQSRRIGQLVPERFNPVQKFVEQGSAAFSLRLFCRLVLNFFRHSDWVRLVLEKKPMAENKRFVSLCKREEIDSLLPELFNIRYVGLIEIHFSL